MTTRRNFIATTALSLAAVGAATNAANAAPRVTDVHPPTLPPLPYAYDALEPFIDAETMRLHHDKHHQGYVNGLIKTEEALEKARASNDYGLIQHLSRQLAFNNGAHFLHSLFWEVMAPAGKGGGGEPTGMLKSAIEQSFGSVDACKAQFSAAAKAVEGSGWALLHYRKADQRLIILQAENQHKLTAWGTTPILGIDVWEHAYYLKYRNDRGAYVNNWWNIVNWPQVQKNMQAAM